MIASREWNSISKEYQEIIKKYQESFPIKVGQIAKDLNLVVKSATLRAGVSGEIRKVGDSYVIRINRHDVKERQRYTLAHEIAHFLLHRDEIGDGIVDTVLYRSRLSDAKEAEANRLAADILMPWEKLSSYYQKHTNLEKVEKLEKVAADLEVSTTALKYRLGLS